MATLRGEIRTSERSDTRGLSLSTSLYLFVYANHVIKLWQSCKKRKATYVLKSGRRMNPFVKVNDVLQSVL